MYKSICKLVTCTLIFIILFAFNACFPRSSNEIAEDGRFFSADERRGSTDTPIATKAPIEAPPTPEAIPTEEPDPSEIWAEIYLSQMTTEEKIGQLIVCRLPNGATAVNDAVKRLVERYHIGGFILFSENVQSIEQVTDLTSGLMARSDIPLFIATDEEGGRVSRVGKLYTDKIASAYNLNGDPEAAYAMGQAIGIRLSELGINMDFAPVADIWSNDANTVIGERAFAKEPETAAVMVEAAVCGLKDAGVLSVIKHFPGHGDTAEDSHLQTAIYPYDRERFESFESVPFKRGMAAGADGVMVGHIATPLMQNAQPVLDWMAPLLETGRLPATFSDYWLRDVLRGEMGFDGLIVTDALEMKALTASFNGSQIALGAFMAGADILLIPADPAVAAEALMNAYSEGIITDARLDESVRRILQAKSALKTFENN